jgi:hypothetical protein
MPTEAEMKKVAGLALVAAAMVMAACSDSAVAPQQELQSAKGGAASQSLTSDTTRISFTYDPKIGGTFDIGGGNTVTFPKSSVCDPTISSYGSTEWDKPCVAATSRITVRVASWIDNQGHPRSDFSPNLRFVPSLDSREWVVITFSDAVAAINPLYTINYCPSPAYVKCVNEALKDPTLTTVRDPRSGKVTRHIKHFSGYNVAAGEEDLSLLDNPLSLSLSRSPRGRATTSLSLSDLQLNSLGSVMEAHPGVSREDAEDMLLRIRYNRKLSGYILASGFEEED